MAIDTMNYFLVGLYQDKVIIGSPPLAMLSRDLALNLAAWLVALADPDQVEFPKVLKALQET